MPRSQSQLVVEPGLEPRPLKPEVHLCLAPLLNDHMEARVLKTKAAREHQGKEPQPPFMFWVLR